MTARLKALHRSGAPDSSLLDWGSLGSVVQCLILPSLGRIPTNHLPCDDILRRQNSPPCRSLLLVHDLYFQQDCWESDGAEPEHYKVLR